MGSAGQDWDRKYDLSCVFLSSGTAQLPLNPTALSQNWAAISWLCPYQLQLNGIAHTPEVVLGTQGDCQLEWRATSGPKYPPQSISLDQSP